MVLVCSRLTCDTAGVIAWDTAPTRRRKQQPSEDFAADKPAKLTRVQLRGQVGGSSGTPAKKSFHVNGAGDRRLCNRGKCKPQVMTSEMANA